MSMATATANLTAEKTPTVGQIIESFQQEAPVNVVGIAERLGVNVWEDDLPRPISGKLFLDKLNGGSSGFSIVINRAESHPRKRFTVAHEIAHFILHRNDLKDGIVEDALFRGALSSKKETEANQLAADILMPFHLIKKLMSEGTRTLSELAEALEVSKPAMAIRLGISYPD
jgi:Zn-dependent peptidase ImmA (M78 family)